MLMLWNYLNLNIEKFKRVKRGTVPKFKTHLGETAPPFITRPGGTTPPIKMHSEDFYDSFFLD